LARDRRTGAQGLRQHGGGKLVTLRISFCARTDPRRQISDRSPEGLKPLGV
jgi:hypothetical protein